MTLSQRSAVLAAACLLSPALTSAQQFTLQHAVHIDLSGSFNGTTINGSNPLSVAFDGNDAYVGGYNSGLVSASVGIVKVGGLLTGAPSFSDLTSFTAVSNRGLNDLAFDRAGNKLYAAYDSGLATTSTVSRYDSTGFPGWQKVGPFAGNPAEQRAWTLAIDPIGDAGSPCVAMMIRGSGRRAALKTFDGEPLWTITGGTAPGGIVNGVGTATGNTDATWRSVAFDSVGNIAVVDSRRVSYGTRVGTNQWQTLGAALNNTSTVALQDNTYDNVGKGVAILENLGSANLLAFSTGTGASTLTSQNGTTSAIAATNLQIRNLDGSTTGLVQTALTGNEDGLGSTYTGALKNVAFGLGPGNIPTLVVVNYVERTLDVYNLEPTWVTDLDSAWDTTNNWRVGYVPNSQIDNAYFGPVISGERGIAVGSTKTVKVLKFNSSFGYILTGGTINLESAGTAQVRALAGSHTITSTVNINQNFQADMAPGSAVTLTGPVNYAPGKTVTKDGSGTLNITRLQATALTINGGRINVTGARSTSNTTIVSSVALAGVPAAWTSSLNVGSNDMIVDYDSPDPSPLDTIADVLKTGYSGNAWTGNGINSSAAAISPPTDPTALGFGEASTLGITVFGGQTLDGDAVLIRYTYMGDATLDGSVNGADFNVLATNFGTQGKFWYQGDFTYDGSVNSADFNLLASNFGNTLVSGPGASVPEPALTGLAALAAMFLARRRR